MQAYSQDLRERVLRALDRGERPAEIARRFEVGRVWVYQVRDRLQKTGKRGSFQIGGHRRSRLADMEPLLRGWIKETADLTLVQMQDRLAICRPIRPISTRLKSSLPNSKRCSVKPRHAPPTLSGPKSAYSSTASHPVSAPTTSLPPDMYALKSKLL